MAQSAGLWKPVADQLIDGLVTNNIVSNEYNLFSYSDNINDILNTSDSSQFNSTIQNWNSYSSKGSKLTFKGLKYVLQNNTNKAFVFVWTDDLGEDTTDTNLKDEIIKLKASTKSEIFIMAITEEFTVNDFNDRFKEVGYVIEVKGDTEAAVEDVVDEIKFSGRV